MSEVMATESDTLAARACERLKAPSPDIVRIMKLIAAEARRIACEPALDSHDYIHGLRLLRGRAWCFSGIPTNSGWVTWYVRKPELRRGRIDFSIVHEAFPEAKERSDGEITVRLREEDDMRKMMDFIAARG